MKGLYHKFFVLLKHCIVIGNLINQGLLIINRFILGIIPKGGADNILLQSSLHIQ